MVLIALFLALMVLSAVEIFSETSKSGKNSNCASELETERFIPTFEWQVIRDGQVVPAGLHYRIDLQTGLKEAKLIDENSKKSDPKSAIILVSSKTECDYDEPVFSSVDIFSVTSKSGENGTCASDIETERFLSTYEWVIRDGQVVPAGLHYFQTGLKEARLIEENSKESDPKSAIILVSSETECDYDEPMLSSADTFSVSSKSSKNGNCAFDIETESFMPTYEWIIKDGQVVPAGLHYLQTGVEEAKLIEENSKENDLRSAIILVSSETECDYNEPVLSSVDIFSVTSKSGENGTCAFDIETESFMPTYEWIIKDGQVVPAGLHYLQTGLKQAKLIEENSKESDPKSAIILVSSETECDYNEPVPSSVDIFSETSKLGENGTCAFDIETESFMPTYEWIIKDGQVVPAGLHYLQTGLKQAKLIEETSKESDPKSAIILVSSETECDYDEPELSSVDSLPETSKSGENGNCAFDIETERFIPTYEWVIRDGQVVPASLHYFQTRLKEARLIDQNSKKSNPKSGIILVSSETEYDYDEPVLSLVDICSEASKSGKDGNCASDIETESSMPTYEWVIRDGQVMPAGLHYLQTGVEEAKLIEENNKESDPRSAIILVSSETECEYDEPVLSSVDMFSETSKSGENGTCASDIETERFIPTSEWQVIREGQVVPAGLHYRIDLPTGLKEAKLIDENSKESDPRSAIILVSSEFKSYEYLKKQFQDINLQIKADLELLDDLLANFTTNNIDQHRDEEEITKILNNLEYLVHQHNNAQQFGYLGGITRTIYPCLSASSVAIRSEAILLLGSAIQNNPKLQIMALASGSISHLLRLLVLDNLPVIRTRAVYALSCLIRRFPVAQLKMINGGGLSVLGQIFQNEGQNDLKLQIKIFTLFYDLVIEHKEADNFLIMNDEGVNREDLLERLRQYMAINIPQHLFEGGWCKRLANLLEVPINNRGQMGRSVVANKFPNGPEHDMVEKVIQAMLVLYDYCISDFAANPNLRKNISNLEKWYDELSLKEQLEETSKSSREDSNHCLYYTNLAKQLRELSEKLKLIK